MLTRDAFKTRFGTRPLFGMVHLRPLPGSPSFSSMSDVLELALADAAAIEKGGAGAIMIENFGDVPFFKGAVPAETVAAMTRVITEIRLQTKLPLGVNVLRNDGISALAIAAATGASIIRVNVLTGAMFTDQGLIESDAANILRKRAALRSEVVIFADHMVKHSTSIAGVDEVQSAKDLRLRAGADAVVVSGKETGGAVDTKRIELLRSAIDAPIVIGSGLTAENAATYRDLVDGAIIGSSIKQSTLDSPVDEGKVRAVVSALA